MPRWEVRKVSGKGFLEDTAERAYRDLNEEGQQALKRAGIDHIGQMMDFINPEPLFEKYKSFDDVPEQELAALPTTWQGKPLTPGSLYCVVTEFDEGGAAASLKKAVAMKMEDRVVAAEGDKLFAAGASAEARKNVAQGERAEGGVWGVRKRGPAR